MRAPAPDTGYESSPAAAAPPATKRKPRKPPPPANYSAAEPPFRPLGYDHGTFYYLSHASRQIIPLTGPGHTLTNLLQLAPLEYWERVYPGRSKPPVDAIADYLFQACYGTGVYDPSRIRGRGAWWDEGRSVMHAGDRLLVDGRWSAISDFKTRYIYEAGKAIPLDAEPMPAAEAARFGAFLGKLTWTDPIAPRLAAGWCVCALVAGALPWHPHLLITARAGSGKSWVMDKIISEVLLNFAFEFKSAVTTEPGIRRSLAGSSLPVMLDDPDGAAQLDKIIELMRACSQSGRARAAQGGGKDGSSVQFELQSSFICSSIIVPVTNEADLGRVTILSLDNSHLTPQEQEDRFTQLKIDRAALLQNNYAARFQARAIKMIPVIRDSIEPFVIAASRVLGNRRGGDQIGALLAGAWSLRSDKPPTLDQAIAWVGEREITQSAPVREHTDELVCLRTISQHHLSLDHGIRRRVDELVRAAIRPAPTPGDILSEAERADDNYRLLAIASLRRHGISAKTDMVYVSNTDKAIKQILARTSWANNWANTLARIKGSERAGSVRFAGGPTRCVAIPTQVFLGDSEPARAREPGED